LANIDTAYAVFASDTVFGEQAIRAIQTILTICAVIAFNAIYTLIEKLRFVAVTAIANMRVIKNPIAIEAQLIIIRLCNHVAILYITRTVNILTVFKSLWADKYSLPGDSI